MLIRNSWHLLKRIFTFEHFKTFRI